MLKRIITAVIAAAALSLVCVFSDTPAFPISLGICALLGIYEMLGCIGARRNFTISTCMYGLCIITIVLTRAVARPSLFVTAYAGLLFCILLILLASSVFSHGSVPFEKLCISFTVCVYIITGFASIILLRDIKNGVYIYLLAFIAPWLTDIFAYFTGVFFGRHKLLPAVSPKKTVEGSVGGVVFCVIGCTVYGIIIKNCFENSLPPVYVFSVVGLVASAVSQIGDLILSLIKRKYGIKDYGFIFPGHGGVLDRFDSIIAVSPLLLIFFGAASTLLY